MSSIVGMRPRTMRSCVAMLYGRTPPLSSSPPSGSSGSPVTPRSRASTSSWERKSDMRSAPLLDDERVEQHRMHDRGGAALGRRVQHRIDVGRDLAGQLSL